MSRAETAAQPQNLPEAVLELAGPECRRLWEEADIKVRRVVVDALMTVTILPRGKSAPKVFNEDSVLIEWRAG